MQIVIVIVAAIASAVWGTRIAHYKNRNELGWGVLCFLLPIIGVIIIQGMSTLEAKPKFAQEGQPWRCPSCGAENPESEPRCHHCETIKQR